MPQVCVGCGLTTDGLDRLIVDGAGEWGDAPLNFPCADSNGMPVYCDSNGQLRTAPGFGGAQLVSQVNEAANINHDLTAGDEHYSPTNIVYTNPSTCRSMLVFAVARAEYDLGFVTGGTSYRLKIGNPLINQGSGAGDTVYRDTTDDDHATHVLERQGVSSNITILTPGQVLNITTGVTSQCLAGTLQVRRHEYTCHAIGVLL